MFCGGESLQPYLKIYVVYIFLSSVTIAIMQEVEGIQMGIPKLEYNISASKISSITDDCKRLQTLVDSNDVVFLLNETWEGMWLPTLLCADKKKVNRRQPLCY